MNLNRQLPINLSHSKSKGTSYFTYLAKHATSLKVVNGTQKHKSITKNKSSIH